MGKDLTTPTVLQGHFIGTFHRDRYWVTDSSGTVTGTQSVPNKYFLNEDQRKAIDERIGLHVRLCKLAFLRNEFAFSVVHHSIAESVFCKVMPFEIGPGEHDKLSHSLADIQITES